jgi:SpoVK/Ycf46/Vps4 family AAA+-type ATPase
MPLPAMEHLTEIEKRTNFYFERIRKIDSILRGPALTLISKAAEGLPEKNSSSPPEKGRIYFPTWISETVRPERVDHLLTQALCSSTLQRLWRLRRRLPWLDKHSRFEEIHDLLVRSFTPEDPREFTQCIKGLNSQTFGCLNPLTASQVFRVFLSAGEDHAHAVMGFLAFFAMVWPLFRRFPDPLNIGASIEPWEPTTYVTANCLLPIKTLQSICVRRAEVLGRVAKNMEKLRDLTVEAEPGQRKRWLFNLELDDLSANLARLSELSIVREEFRKCAESVGKRSADTTVTSDNKATYEAVLKSVGEAFKSVGEKSSEVLTEAKWITDKIQTEIIDHLHDAKENPTANYLDLEKLGFKFAKEFIDDPNHKDKYWSDLRQAAERSLTLCQKAWDKLQSGADRCLKIGAGDFNSISDAITVVKATNEEVATYFEEPVTDATHWCRSVVDREIAHASAKNFTDFDPSELVNAIAVAVRWKLMATPLQVSDAVRRALEGVLPDGSWRPGQPFFSPNHVTGIWPVTSDTVWTLASAIEMHPEVDVADEALFLYVDWLERTKTKLGQERDGPEGWASDRLRHRRKIHLATTAYSINALLEIRDLAEYRLWQVCEERFTVVRNVKGLKDIDPVDLRARHGDRLHSHLARTARHAQDPSYENAIYSLVLHGPPGSSKTSVAEALSAGMWTASSRWGAKESRLVRITPADFTRLGEDRLDSEARMIFELLSHTRAVTILFDEIDDLLRQRNSETARRFQPRFMDLVVPAMLNRLGDLRSACRRQEICFLLGTNYVEKIEPALIRSGRIDRCVAVVYPDWHSRLTMIGRHADSLREQSQKQKKPEEAITLNGVALVLDSLADHIASRTKQWPWMTIDSTCKEIIKNEKLTKGIREIREALANNSDAALTGVLGEPDSQFKKIIDEILTNNESSFSEPEYGSLRWRDRFSPQLFDEYLHYLMAGFDDWAECEKHLRGEAKKIEDTEKIAYWNKDIEVVINSARTVWN